MVQNIRSQGFDVLLMLEATIGLNEVEKEPDQAPETIEGTQTFTPQDVNFLRSLRISVEGDEGRETDTNDDNGEERAPE